MSIERWGTEVATQKDLLQLEQDVVLDLLEQIRELELDPGNCRDLQVERIALREHLTRLAAERARLDREAAALENTEAERQASIAERGQTLGTQIERLGGLLGEWRTENARGRRRRLRDHMWLDAMLLEKARLESERRRLREQEF